MVRRGGTKVILKEHGDTGDSFVNLMKNTRDLRAEHEKMLEIVSRSRETIKFMKIVSKLLKLHTDDNEENSPLYSLAKWMDFEINACLQGIDIPLNSLGLPEYGGVSKEQTALVDQRYNMLMDSFTIMNMIEMCKNLNPYRQHLCTEREDEIIHPSGRKTVKKIVEEIKFANREGYVQESVKFFNKIPGNIFKPFTVKSIDSLLDKIDAESSDEEELKTVKGTSVGTFTTPLIEYKDQIKTVVELCREIDIKEIYNDNFDDELMKYTLMLVCSKLYVRTYEVSQSIRIPDMDPSKLRGAIENALERYKNERTIKDNMGAYREIIDSVAMLEENFDSYYNGYVKTGNIANIFEQYVVDVAEAKKDKKHMKMQFSRIITFFKMKAAPILKNSQSPELKNLFNAADKKFSSFMDDAEMLELKEEFGEIDTDEKVNSTPETDN